MSEQHPESLTRHDPYINRAFLAIMGHEDNADVARAVTVGLAINDPERVSAAGTRHDLDDVIAELGIDTDAPAAGAAPTAASDDADMLRRRPHISTDTTGRRRPLGHYEGDDDVLAGVDRDGDIFRASFLIGHCDDHGTEAAMVLRATAGGYLLPVEELPAFIGWLQGRLRKFRDGEVA